MRNGRVRVKKKIFKKWIDEKLYNADHDQELVFPNAEYRQKSRNWKSDEISETALIVFPSDFGRVSGV